MSIIPIVAIDCAIRILSLKSCEKSCYPTPRIQLSVRSFVRSSVPIFDMHHTCMHHKYMLCTYRHTACVYMDTRHGYIHHGYMHKFTK